MVRVTSVFGGMLLLLMLSGCQGGAFDMANENADLDGDGFSGETDCDDTDPEINPDGIELCDGIDNNCDGVADDSPDDDADGYSSCPTDGSPTDCDDQNSDVKPGIADPCDGIDNNCDGQIDEEDDADQDGVCTMAGDCDDTNANIFPGNEEVCDGLDNDCDQAIDEDLDADGDGYIPCGELADCDDGDPNISPEGYESCDGVDNNCDGVIDEQSTEVCDGLDNDCDGEVDEELAPEWSGDAEVEVEPNDSGNSGLSLESLMAGDWYEVEGVISAADDVDWYHFTLGEELQEGWGVEIKLEQIALGANYDLFLWRLIEGEVESAQIEEAWLTSSQSLGNADEHLEYVTVEKDGAGMGFGAEVVGVEGTFACLPYRLSIRFSEPGGRHAVPGR